MFWLSRLEEKQCSWCYNVRSASLDTNKDMLHSGQSRYKQSTNSSRGKDLRDLQLTCWMFRHILLLFLLSAQKETYSVAVVWHFSSWGILKPRQCVAVQQMPTPYIPKHHLLLLISVFLLVSSFQSFIASQHELNQRNNQIRYSTTGVSSNEYWRVGYSRRQFRAPSLPSICSSTATNTEQSRAMPQHYLPQSTGKLPPREEEAVTPRWSASQWWPEEKSERWNMQRIPHTPLTGMSRSFLFSSETRSILRHFWSRGTATRLCLGGFFAIT